MNAAAKSLLLRSKWARSDGRPAIAHDEGGCHAPPFAEFGARWHRPLRMSINNPEARHVFVRDRRLPLRHAPPACSISWPRLRSTFAMTASRPIVAFTVVCLLAGASSRAFAQSGKAGMDHSKHPISKARVRRIAGPRSTATRPGTNTRSGASWGRKRAVAVTAGWTT